jgi:hypothetical protein
VEAKEASRNAQNIASMFNAALAAGAVQLEEVKSVEEAYEMLSEGVVIRDGVFKGKRFSIDISKREFESAKEMLKLNGQGDGIRYVAR